MTSECFPDGQVGQVLDEMLTQTGDPKKPEEPSLKKFWTLNDPQIAEMRKQIKDIVEQALYGDRSW